LTPDRERDHLKSKPELIDISNEIHKKYNIPRPVIKKLEGHRIYVQIHFIFEELPPEKDIIIIKDELVCK